MWKLEDDPQDLQMYRWIEHQGETDEWTGEPIKPCYDMEIWWGHSLPPCWDRRHYSNRKAWGSEKAKEERINTLGAHLQLMDGAEMNNPMTFNRFWAEATELVEAFPEADEQEFLSIFTEYFTDCE